MMTKGFINKVGDKLYFHPEYRSEEIEIKDGDSIEFERGPDDWNPGLLVWNGSYWECHEGDSYSKFGPVTSLNVRMDI